MQSYRSPSDFIQWFLGLQLSPACFKCRSTENFSATSNQSWERRKSLAQNTAKDLRTNLGLSISTHPQIKSSKRFAHYVLLISTLANIVRRMKQYERQFAFFHRTFGDLQTQNYQGKSFRELLVQSIPFIIEYDVNVVNTYITRATANDLQRVRMKAKSRRNRKHAK